MDKPVSLREFVVYCKKNYDWLIFDKWISRLISNSFERGVIEQMYWVIFPESILGIPDDKKLQVEIDRVDVEDNAGGGFIGTANTFNYYWDKYSYKSYKFQSIFNTIK